MQGKRSGVFGARTEVLVVHVSRFRIFPARRRKQRLTNSENGGGLYMSNFLQMMPRRLSVALADYVAVTGQAEFQRRDIARRIYGNLSIEQQAELGRLCEAIGANGKAWTSGRGLAAG